MRNSLGLPLGNLTSRILETTNSPSSISFFFSSSSASRIWYHNKIGFNKNIPFSLKKNTKCLRGVCFLPKLNFYLSHRTNEKLTISPLHLFSIYIKKGGGSVLVLILRWEIQTNLFFQVEVLYKFIASCQVFLWLPPQLLIVLVLDQVEDCVPNLFLRLNI